MTKELVWALGDDTAEPEALRHVMRRWASGVTIVASRDGDRRHGMTVSAFSSVSLDPPLVLIALQSTTRTHTLVQASQRFAVGILAADQKSLSDRFAGRSGNDEDRFDGVETMETPAGIPIPTGCLAYMDCRVIAAHPAGAQVLYVGEVTATAIVSGGDPLLYFDQDYRWLSPEA